MGTMINGMWELSLLSRSEHRDLADWILEVREKDPELCAVKISVYLIWESLAPHLPLSGLKVIETECGNTRLWVYLDNSAIGMIKHPESKFEFKALWRGEIWHDLTVYCEKSISPSTEVKVLVSNLVTDKSIWRCLHSWVAWQTPLLEKTNASDQSQTC